MAKASVVKSAKPRITEAKLKNLHTLAYDTDNAYPQRMRALVNSSSTAKSAVGLYAKFMGGGGFADPIFWKARINDDKQTPDDLLKLSMQDVALMRGMTFHVNYNASYQKTDVTYIPFENARLTLFDENDPTWNNKIALADNWYVEGTIKKAVKEDDIDFIDRFDTNPREIERQVNEAGGWEHYKGQVLYFSLDYGDYPLASCDPIIVEMLTEAASALTSYNNVRNNFSEKTVFTIGDEFETEQERYDFAQSLTDFVGPDGDNILLVEGNLNDSKEVAAPVVTKIPNTLNDKIFEYTDNKTTRKIIRNYMQPGILHTDTSTSALGKDDIINASDYYNKIVEDERIAIERVFEKLFSNFAEEINPANDYSIIPYSFYAPRKGAKPEEDEKKDPIEA